jgi:rhodanese-related sulfurtransferase
MEFVQNNLLLIGVAFVSGALLLWPYVRRSAGGPAVDNTKATLLINREDALVLDVRDSNEFANGHVLGAKNIPLAQLESRVGELGKHQVKPVIVVCKAARTWRPRPAPCCARGASPTFTLAGGYQAWFSAACRSRRSRPAMACVLMYCIATCPYLAPRSCWCRRA